MSSYNGKGFTVQHWGDCGVGTDTGSNWKTLKEAVIETKEIKKFLPDCDCDVKGFYIMGTSGKYNIQGKKLNK